VEADARITACLIAKGWRQRYESCLLWSATIVIDASQQSGRVRFIRMTSMCNTAGHAGGTGVLVDQLGIRLGLHSRLSRLDILPRDPGGRVRP